MQSSSSAAATAAAEHIAQVKSQDWLFHWYLLERRRLYQHWDD